MSEELRKAESQSRVNMTEFSQTICTAVQVALVDLLRQLRVLPKMVVGHSSGEIAGAYCCGAISRQSAWKIAYYRGQWSSKLEEHSYIRGSMLAVALPKEKISGYFEKVGNRHIILRLTIACVNSPKSVTISGEDAHIDSLKSLLDAEQVFCRKLRVKVAYHSFQMHEIAPQYLASMGSIEPPSSPLPGARPQMASSVTGTWIDNEVLETADYWVRNMVSQVNFSDALTLICSGVDSPTKKLDGSHKRRLRIHHLVEIGPHSALQGPVKDVLDTSNAKSITYSSVLVRKVSAISSLLTVAGNLYAAGYPVDIEKANRLDDVHTKNRLHCLNDLPEYPFNHSKSYWHESRISRNQRIPVAHKHELLGTPDPNWNPNEPRWRNIIRDTTLPWVHDHKVLSLLFSFLLPSRLTPFLQINGTILYPATGMTVMPIEAAKQLSRTGRQISGFNIRNISFLSAIQITEGEHVETDFHMRPTESLKTKDSDWFDFTLFTCVGSGWVKNCSGTIQTVYEPEERDAVNGKRIEERLLKTQIASLEKARAECTDSLHMESIYPALEKSGYMYGDIFRRIIRLFTKPQDYNTLLAEISNCESTPDTTIHPAPLDAVIQTALCFSTECGSKSIPMHVPTYIEKLWVSAQNHPNSSETFTVMTSGTFDIDTGMSASMTAFGPTFTKPVIILNGLHCTMVGESQSSNAQQSTKSRLCSEIEWKPDIRHLENKYLQALFNKPSSKEITDRLLQLDFVLLARVVDVLRTFSEQGVQPKKPYLHNYLDWARHQQDRLDRGESFLSDDPWRSRLHDWKYIHNLENELLEDDNIGRFASFPITVSRNLVDLLTDSLDPLQFFFSSGLLEGHYGEMVGSIYRNQMASLG